MRQTAMRQQPSAVERGERRLLYVVAVVFLGMCCCFVWMMGWPVYWYLLSEVFAPVRSEGIRPPRQPLPAFLLQEIKGSQSQLEHKVPETQVESVSPAQSELPRSISTAKSAVLSIPPRVVPTGAGNQPKPEAAQPSAQDAAKARIRQETHRSRHGVAVDPAFHMRRPQGTKDEELVEEDHIMNPETIQKLADKDGYIMVTWANNHYWDFVQNWVEHVEELGITAYTVGAMDNKILGNLVRSGMPCFAMQSGLTHQDFGWGSKNFHIMGRKKIKLVQLFTEMNLTVIISDVDTVWLRNPFEYFKRYPEADILTSSDGLTWTNFDEGLEDHRRAGAAFNIGIMMFSPKSVEFAKEWVEWIEKDPNIWDQNAFNSLVRRGMRFLPDGHPGAAKRLFLGDNGKLVCGILPVSIFASGHTFFVSRLHEQLNLNPYVVHATFQYSGTPGKRNRIREFKLWNDRPEYYDHPVGFVTWRFDIPEDLLSRASPGVNGNPQSIECCDAQQGHFNLVNHQLLQFRHGLAIATALKRAVIIPQFIAGQDRWWAPHTGRLPAAKTPLPYMAPIDHILDLERGLRNKAEGEFGPNLIYKEYSFLQNPRTPDSVRRSNLTVQLCPMGSTDAECADGSGPAVANNDRVKVRAGLSDEQIRTVFSGVANQYKVFFFDSMVDAFSKFENPADQSKFIKRTRMMPSIWCCVRPPVGQPGHVWYDLWWDTVPHKDLHGRHWDEPWKIKLGP